MGTTRKHGGQQQGAQRRAEGTHGPRTQSQIARTAHTSTSDAGAIGPRYDEEEIQSHVRPGHNRMFEGRVQHDEADLNSEKTRLARDMERHDHEARGELGHRNVRSTGKRKS